jgi:hypothetical protein
MDIKHGMMRTLQPYAKSGVAQFNGFASSCRISTASRVRLRIYCRRQRIRRRFTASPAAGPYEA